MKLRTQDVFNQIHNLVSINTSPENPTLPVVNYIKDIFDEHGLDYTIKPFGNNDRHAVMLGRLGPDRPGGVLFSGHLDVVNVQDQKWSYHPFGVTLDSGRLYGRGTCDMKGFIGSILSLIPLWQSMNLSYPIYFGFSCDEETNVESINMLTSLIGPNNKPDIAVLGEPTSMQVINGHKGVYDLSVELHGIGGHSSRPDLAVDAIRLAHKTSEFIYKRSELIKTEYADDNYKPPFPTLDVVKTSGGSGINKIPELATLYYHMRQTDNKQTIAEKEKLQEFLKNLTANVEGSRFEIEDKLLMPALERRNDTVAQKFMAALGFDTTDRTVPFCTEAGYLQEIGMETVVCGPGDIAQAHTTDEYVEVSQIMGCVDRFSKLPKNMPS